MIRTAAALLAATLLARPDVAAAQRAEEISFVSRGATLSGTVVWPTTAPIVAAVVFVHGSGPQRRNSTVAQQFATRGIAALVYDKRGVGTSGGTYEGNRSVTGMNIDLLADDAAAALDTLANRAAPSHVPVGFSGISQAGWIVPVAATRSSKARFLLLWSAPVCRVSEEDIYSKFTGDVDGPDRPSFSAALASRTEAYLWPDFLGRDTDPSEDLLRLTIPGFWLFGARDGSIPVDLSVSRLSALRADGHRFEHHVFAAEGHNNMTATFEAAVEWLHTMVRTQTDESPGIRRR